MLGLATGHVAGLAQASDPTPVQAMDEHPIYEAVGTEQPSSAILAQMLVEDADRNGATDFLDLWTEEALATGYGDAPVEVLAHWEHPPTAADAEAFRAATDAHHAEALDRVDAIFATVDSDRAHDGLALEGLELLVWEPRAHAMASDPAGDDPVHEMDHVTTIGAKAAQEAGYTGANATVAILDTGIDCQHPAFQHEADGRQIDGCGDKVVDFAAYADGSGDPAGFDDNGHGTHVASTAAGYEPGNYTGIAPGADLVGLKVLDADGSGSLSWFEDAVEYLEANNDTVDVASMSAGLAVPPLGLTPINGGELDVFGWDRVAAEVPGSAEVPFTVAAGNTVFGIFELLDGEQAPPVGVNGVNRVASPGFDPALVTVGSVTSYGVHAGHSAVGPGPTGELEAVGGHGEALVKPNVVATGYDVWGAEANADGYEQRTGTSMATPAAAGVLALLTEETGDLGPEQARRVLEATAKPGRVVAHLEGTQNPQPDFKDGHGVVQADEALQAIRDGEVSAEEDTRPILDELAAPLPATSLGHGLAEAPVDAGAPAWLASLQPSLLP